MIDTGLILIEGLSGSGKSTCAQRLWLHLGSLGRPARWFYEHDTGHPIWPIDEQDERAKAGALDPAYLDGLPARWRALAAGSGRTGPVTILEGALFQATLGFLLAMNVDAATITRVVGAIAESVAGMRPALVYLRQPDVEGALRATFADRADSDFEGALIARLAATPYGRANGLRDFDGLVRFYEGWRTLTEALIPKLPWPTLAVDLGTGDWTGRERRITAFLGLPEIRDEPARIEGPDRFMGRYRDARSQDVLAIVGDETCLRLDDARQTRLIPAARDQFRVAAMPVEVGFGDARDGRFHRLTLSGPLPDLSPVWLRVGEGA